MREDKWRTLARKRASSDELGEEVFAVAMASICGRLDQLDEITDRYVTTTIENVATDLREKEATRRKRRADAVLDELEDARIERPDAFAARSERRTRLGVAMDDLPEEHCRVVELRDLEDRTEVDAASEVGATRKTVRRRRREAYAMLKQALGPRRRAATRESG